MQCVLTPVNKQRRVCGRDTEHSTKSPLKVVVLASRRRRDPAAPIVEAVSKQGGVGDGITFQVTAGHAEIAC